jgi:hypothetical protein
VAVSRTLIRFREVTLELADLHRELAQVRMAEKQAKVEVWRNAPVDAPVTHTREVASMNAGTFSVDAIRIQGDIDAYREEKDFLVEALRMGVDLGASVDGH